MGTNQSRLRTRLAAVIGMLAVGLISVLGAGSAAAEPPYQTDAAITSIDFTNETIQSGSLAQIQATWSLPDNAASPAGLQIELPPALQGRVDSFPMLDDDGVVMGQCTVTATLLYCDFDAAYLAANPRDVTGDVNFWVRVSTQVTEETEVTYDFGNAEATTTVTPPQGTCPSNCGFQGRDNYKWGSYQPDTDTVEWGVAVKAPATGMAGDQDITVVDHPGPNQVITRAWVVQTNQVGTNAQGYERPINWQDMPAEQFTVSGDLTTVSFRSQPGYFYEIRYTTDTTDDGASSEYTNAADITIQGEETVPVTTTVQSQGGSANGSGTNVGRFSITKDVLGDVGAVEGLTYSGTFEVTTPTGAVVDGSFEVVDGQTWTSAEYPRGSTVHLVEVTPTEPGTVTWSDPIFSENDVTLVGGTTTAITLTNEATLRTGAFSVAKTVEGSGASLVPQDASFVVRYSYPAGDGFEAGAGELTVPADGTVVASGQLPVGAVVTLSEVAPAAVQGLTWGEPTFSTSTVTIGADTVVAVGLTNTATVVPPSSTPPQAQMPDTGADVSVGALIGALALITAGATLVVIRRRQQA